MINLREYRDYLSTMENELSPKIIDKFVKDLFLELTGNLLWEFDRNFDFEDEMYDFAELDEQYVSLDFEETLTSNGLDICVRLEFNVNASQHRESDGMRFFENMSVDLTKITFDCFGQEWDLTGDKEAIEVVMDILNDYV